jgi:hypothetical protein
MSDFDTIKQNKIAGLMNKAKLDEYNRGVESEKAEADVYRSAVGVDGKTDRTKLYTGLAQRGHGAKISAKQKAFAEQDKAEREADLANLDGMIKKVKIAGQIMGSARDQPTYDLALAQMKQLLPEKANEMPLNYDPTRIQQGLTQAMTVTEQLEAKQKEIAADLAERKFTEDKRKNLATEAETRRGHNMADSRARAGGGGNGSGNGRAPRGYRWTENGDLAPIAGGPAALKTGGKPMTAQQEAKYRTQIAKDYQSANTILSNMDEVAASAEAVKTAPGLKGATGLQSYLPSYPDSEASQAEIKLQNLEGKVTSLGKAAASMSGAVGPMAVQEWKIVRDMIAAIDPKKGEQSLKEQIALVEENARGASARIRDAYEKHYSADFERYPQFQEIGSKKPSAPTDQGSGKQAVPSALPRVTDAASFAKVPSGAKFIHPDGSTRRKP